MAGGVGGAAGVPFLEAGAGGDVDLAADDRLDAGGHRLLVELDGAEHVAVVGDRQGRHAAFLGALDQVADLDGAVEEAVLAVQMEMDEIGVFHRNQ